MFHGAVVGIDWPGSTDTTEVGGPPDPACIVVAAGDTMAETMAALIADANNAPAQAPIVEALQLGVLGRTRPARRPGPASTRNCTRPRSPANPEVRQGRSRSPSRPAAHRPPPKHKRKAPTPGSSVRRLPGGGSARQGGNVAQGGTPTHPSTPSTSAQLMTPEVRAPGAATEVFATGGLATVVDRLGAEPLIRPRDAGGDFIAARAAPRRYTARDPILLLHGGKRAFTHDSSVKTENGMVMCRLMPASDLSWTMPGRPERFHVAGADILEGGIANGSVPLECQGLLCETVLLDTGSAPAIAAAAASQTIGTFDAATATQHVIVEQTAWYALRNPRIDPAPLLARSGIAGTLPAAFALGPAAHPWTPLHADWQVEYLPSPNGENDWTLGRTRL